MQAVILAGGNGVRLYPYTSVIPKPLLPLDDMPIIEIIVKQLVHHGFTRISIASGYLGELIKTYLGNGSKYGVQIDYSIESKPLGTIAPLTLLNNLDSTILVIHADLLTTLDFKTLLEFHKEKQAAATVGMICKSIKSDYGVIDTNGDDLLEKIREKPEFKMYVNMGIYIIETRILDYLPKKQPQNFPEFINFLIESGEKVAGYRFNGYWLDIGQHCDYDRALNEFSQYRGEMKID